MSCGKHLGAACEDEKGTCSWRAHPRRRDSDNSDEGDCKASNTDGTDDEEEGNDGEDAYDCDAGEPRRFRTMKGDKCFLLPRGQVLAKPFKILFSSRKQFRKDYECAFKTSACEMTRAIKTDVVLESSICKAPMRAATRAPRPILSGQVRP